MVHPLEAIFFVAAGAVVGRFGRTVDTGLVGGAVGLVLPTVVDVGLSFKSGDVFDIAETVFTTPGVTFVCLLTFSVESFFSFSSALPFSSSKESVGRLAYPLG